MLARPANMVCRRRLVAERAVRTRARAGRLAASLRDRPLCPRRQGAPGHRGAEEAGPEKSFDLPRIAKAQRWRAG